MARKSSNINKHSKKLLYSLISLIILLLVYFLPKISDKFGNYFDFFDDPRAGTPTNGEIAVHYIDVGQGDSMLILTDDRRTMLIDTGTPDSRSFLIEYLDQYNVDELDYLILTHPHSDHIGGASAVLDNIDVKNVIMPDAIASTSTFENLLKKLDSLEKDIIIAEPGKTYSLGDARFKLLGPVESYNEELNNQSIVLRLDYGTTSFLFTGDAETAAEADMLEFFPAAEFEADVLKMGHHGSSTSTSNDFFSLVNPKYAVITCGKNNDYGHPHREIISLLDKHDVKTFRTDTMGSVILISDGATVSLPNGS